MFLLVFHCNYHSVFYHFRDKVRYWSKIAIFICPTVLPVFDAQNIAVRFGTEKLEWCGYPTVKKKSNYMFSRFATVLAFDGQTDILQQRLRYACASHGNKSVTLGRACSRNCPSPALDVAGPQLGSRRHENSI